jgi:formate hydrogenlyase transcriptional activator
VRTKDSVAPERLGALEPYRLAVEASPSGILVVDPAGTIVLLNREIERQFGYARAELVGRSVDVLLPEALGSSHAAQWQAFALTPEARPMGDARDLLGRRMDGALFPVEIGLTPIETGGGLFVLASVVDISEHRRLDQAHRDTLEDQRAFERLVSELSVQFINLPADQIDEGIRGALRRIAEAFAIDRCTLYRLDSLGTFFDAVSFTARGVAPLPAPLHARERFPWTLAQLLDGRLLTFSTVGEIPSETDRAGYRALGTKSALAVPLSVAGTVVGAVGFSTVSAERPWPPEVVHRLTVMATAFAQLLARRQGEEVLRKAVAEVERLKNDLQAENVHLRREARERFGMARVVGKSAAVGQVLDQIEQVAMTDSTVLLLGETGVGKELFATQIHELGLRRGRPMIRVNCAAIPATLIESELFGREKGAFTGALAQQVGRFELAHGSTIFLDEIGDLPPDVQVKLLRVLEEGQLERLGSPHPRTVDARVIAATHRDLEECIVAGTFREDLYYRLNVFPIRVPPLRDRVEDIPLLVWRFVEEFSSAFGKHVDIISEQSLAALQQYSWPGNIRELRNVVERAMITVSGNRLTLQVPQASAAGARRSSRLVDVEREHIRVVLESTGWRIRGAGGAADKLGLKPTTLETRLAKLGLKRPGARHPVV